MRRDELTRALWLPIWTVGTAAMAVAYHAASMQGAALFPIIRVASRAVRGIGALLVDVAS